MRFEIRYFRVAWKHGSNARFELLGAGGGGGRAVQLSGGQEPLKCPGGHELVEFQTKSFSRGPMGAIDRGENKPESVFFFDRQRAPKEFYTVRN